MTPVLRPDELLQELRFPNLEAIDDLRLNDQDHLICCVGFEDRATGVLGRLQNSSGKVSLIDYLPVVSENKGDSIRNLCSEKQLRTEGFTYDRLNPTGFSEGLLGKIQDTQGRVYLDISAMSRHLIVQFMVVYQELRRGFTGLSVLYSEAERYPPTEEDYLNRRAKEGSVYEEMFLSSGVVELAAIPELSSDSLYGQPVHLICFPSFNRHQFLEARRFIQPSTITLIHGVSPREEYGWRTNSIRELNQPYSKSSIDNIETSTLDYVETVRALVSVYADHSVHERLVISPTGSKMQTMAVGLLRSHLHDIQIVYPTPRQYVDPDTYTIGVRQVYQVDLDELSPTGS